MTTIDQLLKQPEVFIVVLKEAGKRFNDKTYKSRKMGESAVNRSREYRRWKEKLVVMTIDEFKAQDIMVEVVNIMSGKPFMTPRSVAGSACCPSSETYWSA